MNEIAADILEEVERPLDDGYFIPSRKLAEIGHGNVAHGRALIRMQLADLRHDSEAHMGPTEHPRVVRLATMQDEQQVFDLVMRDLQQNAVQMAPISAARVWQNIHFCTRPSSGKVGGIIGVIEENGAIVGAVCLVPYQWWFSENYHLCEIFVYVHDEHRKPAYAAALLQFSKWVGDEWSKGVDYRVYVLMGVQAVRRMMSKIRLYRRSITQIGAFFCYPAPMTGETTDGRQQIRGHDEH